MEKTLGQKLITLREAKGMTQDELATQSGISRPQISRLENDDVDVPRRNTLAKLATVLDVPLLTLNAQLLDSRKATANLEGETLAQFENVILHERIAEQNEELNSKEDEITKLRTMVAYLKAELGKFGSSLEAAWGGLHPVGPRAGAMQPA